MTRLLAVLLGLLALVASGCVYQPTQITIVVDSDLRGRPGLELRVVVRRGAVPIGPDAAPDFIRPTDAGMVLRGDAGSLTIPASFAVVLPPGARPDELVTVQVELAAGTIALRQTRRVRFVPRQATVLRMYLSALCATIDQMCGSRPCSRQQACEEMGMTCGADARCVPVQSPEDGGTESMDGSADGARTDIVTGPRCGDGTCNGTENHCSCAMDCMVRGGDGCCSPGQNNCSDSDCPVMGGDNCCSPGQNNCGDPDCPVTGGDGCCSPGRNNCSDPDCPVASGDGCCSPGHNNCNDSDCGVAHGDGCCSPGHNNCNDSDCPVVNQDGCCSGGENRCVEGGCPGCNNNGVCECGEYWDTPCGDCNCEARCCDDRIEGRFRGSQTECFDSRTFVCGATGTLRVRWAGGVIWMRTAACP